MTRKKKTRHIDVPIRNLKVMLGVVSLDMVNVEFALCLAALVTNKMKGVDLSMMNARGAHITQNRNRCVQAAFDSGADKILFIDTDMVFPSTTLQSLLSHGKAIVASDAVRRVPPHNSLANYEDGTTIPPDIGLVEAGFVGTGCILIDLRVFRKLGEPYFSTMIDETDGRFIGEDYKFSKDARDAGFKVYCDTDLDIGHIGQGVFRIRD